LQFMMISLKPSRNMEVYNSLANQDIVGTRDYTTQQNNIRYVMLLNDSFSSRINLIELRKRSDNLYKEIEKIKLGLLNTIEDKNDTAIDYARIPLHYEGNDNIPNSYLFDNLGQPKPALSSVRNDVDSFNIYIKTAYKKNSFGMINTKGTKDVKGDGHIIPWEIFNFYQVPFSVVLRNLTQMQLDIRVIEATCIH
ncbi:MAG: hypothetical protein ABI388_00990, partial [Bacteroidia bacterium]